MCKAWQQPTKIPWEHNKERKLCVSKALRQRSGERRKKNNFLCAEQQKKDKFVLKRVNKGCRTTLFVFYSCADEMDAELFVISFRRLKDSRFKHLRWFHCTRKQRSVMNKFSLEVSNFKCFSCHSRLVTRDTFNYMKAVNTNVAELRQINYQMIRSVFALARCGMLHTQHDRHVWSTWNLVKIFVWQMFPTPASVLLPLSQMRVENNTIL